MAATYLVVGGSKGIGRALAEQLVADGNTVHVFSRTNSSLAGVIEHTVDVLNMDTSTLPVIENLNGIVYCPGSINLKPFNRLKLDDFTADMNINLYGAIKIIQHCLPQLAKQDNASIVLFSTVAVKMGMPFHASIAAAKGAVEGLTKSLAAELAPKIRVNAIAPSLTLTPLADKLTNTEEKIQASAKRHPLGRIGHADEIAKAVKFVLTNDSSWVTGQIIHIDGGISSIKVN